MVEMQVFGSLELMLLHEKVADSAELPLPARKGERSQCSDCQYYTSFIAGQEKQYAGTDGRWQFSCVQV